MLHRPEPAIVTRQSASSMFAGTHENDYRTIEVEVREDLHEESGASISILAALRGGSQREQVITFDGTKEQAEALLATLAEAVNGARRDGILSPVPTVDPQDDGQPTPRKRSHRHGRA